MWLYVNRLKDVDMIHISNIYMIIGTCVTHTKGSKWEAFRKQKVLDID